MIKMAAVTIRSAFYNPCVCTEARRAWGAWVSLGRTFSPSRRVTFGPHHSWKEQEWTRAGSEGERAHAMNKSVKTSQETWVRNDPITISGLRASGSPRDFTVICFKPLIFPEWFPPFRPLGRNEHMDGVAKQLLLKCFMQGCSHTLPCLVDSRFKVWLVHRRTDF